MFGISAFAQLPFATTPIVNRIFNRWTVINTDQVPNWTVIYNNQ